MFVHLRIAKIGSAFACIFLLFVAGCTDSDGSAADKSGAGGFARKGMAYRVIKRKKPRPLVIHVLTVDLAREDIMLDVALPGDPDGDGPAEAVLVQPLGLAASSSALAFINTHPFRSLPDKDGKRHHNWYAGLPVDMVGLAVRDGNVRSQPEKAYPSLWFDRHNNPHLGHPDNLQDVRCAVSGFGWLVKDGKPAHRPDKSLHPRTMVGLDEDRTTLFLVVVDGRQKGYSEGMCRPEMADIMLELGCHDALNMDGGGSSVMILEVDGRQAIVNSPSTKILGITYVRPLPSGLIVRAVD